MPAPPDRRRTRARFAALLSALLCAGGCGPQGAPAEPMLEMPAGQPRARDLTGTADEQNPEPAPSPDPQRIEPEAVQGDPDAVAALAGEYAARVVYQQLQTLDVGLGLGGTLLNTTTALDRVTIEADGTYVEQACDVQLASEDGDGSSELFVAQATLRPALFARLPPLIRRVVFDGERWELLLADQAIGWRAEADVNQEDLPTRADDPRLVDDDGDGNPGVTTTLSDNPFANGDLYVVQRKRNRMLGTLSGDTLDGEVFDDSEQQTLGGTAPQAEQTLQPAGNARTNRVVLVPVDPTLSCEALIQQADTLFPPHPVFGDEG